MWGAAGHCVRDGHCVNPSQRIPLIRPVSASASAIHLIIQSRRISRHMHGAGGEGQLLREGHLSIHHAVEHGLAIGIDGVSETAKPWTPKPSGRHVNMAWCLEAGMHGRQDS